MAIKKYGTLTYGQTTAPMLRDLIRKAGMVLSDLAEVMLTRTAFVVAQTERKIVSVALTYADLGFLPNLEENSPTLIEIHKAGLGLGYTLFPADAALKFRLLYNKQPVDESLNVAMEPIDVASPTEAIKNPRILRVDNDRGVLKLRTSPGSHDRVRWGSTSTWLFAAKISAQVV